MSLSESVLRPSVFLLFYLGFLVLEYWQASHAHSDKTTRQWNNLLLFALGLLTIRLLPPATLALTQWQGAWCEQINAICMQRSMPFWLQCVLGVLVLDFAVYWQHRAMHLVPLFWRFHRVHHSDLDLDVSSGVRFHPLELIVSQMYKLCIVLMVGIPLEVWILFDMLLNTASLFVHAKIRLPKYLQRSMEKILVTPVMHRVHHHVLIDDTNSNYATLFKVWDVLFRSYRAPVFGERLRYGLEQHSLRRQAQPIKSLLLMPFKP